MTDDLLSAARELSYASPLIIERRRRILRETRRMLATSGLDGLSLRELSRQSNVAPRTIYNAFGSKERLIALAIRQHREDFARDLNYAAGSTTLEGALERAAIGNLRSRRFPNYTQAIVAIYFSPRVDASIHAEIRAIAVEHLHPWLESVRAAKRLRPATDWDGLTELLADIQYLNLLDWGRGAIPEEIVLPRLLECLLLPLAAATRGSQRDEITTYLDDVQSRGPRWRRLAAEAARAVAQASATLRH